MLTKLFALTATKRVAVCFMLLLCSPALLAHTINYALEKAPVQDVAQFYLLLGIEHIVPGGLDHILFVVGLCLLNNNIKTILWQATAFTLAHSITLALSMKGIISLPAGIVEPIIALSIVFIAVENMLIQKLKPWRVGVVFLFGLIHGLGFASSLNEIGLPPNRFFLSILSFNIGVEIGQIIVIALLYALIIYPFGKKASYRKWLVFPVSLFIAAIAMWWTFERL